MNKIRILWTDDEIELLKPHIIFLQNKGYEVVTTNNGNDALEYIIEQNFDIIFLDEQMPGLSGIQTLETIKNINDNIPVVMITKSEEEHLMENAIGSNIADYLIKPVNPNQILLCLKKILDNKKIFSEKTSSSYQQEFRNISTDIGTDLNYEEWANIYKRLVTWELRFDRSSDQNMYEVFEMQKHEANNLFSKFIEKNYKSWINGTAGKKPVMSHYSLAEYVFPVLGNKPKFLIVVDNLRLDQWKVIEKRICELYRTDNEHIIYSILPTTTQYARNALFAGLMPLDIQTKYPQYWVNEEEEETKNQYEEFFLSENLKRHNKGNIQFSYHKILNLQAGRKYLDVLPQIIHNDFNVLVYNFVDILSHARTEMEIIKELADDEAAYRSLTESWFEHSALYDVIEYLHEKQIDIIITTDHGSVKVTDAIKILGDKYTNTNLRYKVGKNLNYNKKDVIEALKPEELRLPKGNLTSSYAFAKSNNFFAYPNNYNYYVSYYKNSFQHGGVSMEEMLTTMAFLSPK